MAIPSNTSPPDELIRISILAGLTASSFSMTAFAVTPKLPISS